MLEQQPPPNEKIETLFALYQQYMDTQHELIALRREMLTLPALPDEGYWRLT